MLDRYAQLKSELAEIQNEISQIEADLRDQVETSGEVAGFGFRAYMKPGRKSTDHEAAIKALFEEYNQHGMHGMAVQLSRVVDKYSTTKTTVQWAKVTKDAKVKNLSEFITESAPTFVVEAID